MKKVVQLILIFLILVFAHSAQCRSVVESDSTRGAQLYKEGMNLYIQGKYEQSLDIFDQALMSFSEKNLQGYATTLIRIGIVYATIPDFEQAILFFEKAEVPSLKVKNQLGIYQPIINQQMQLAFTLYQLRLFDEALPVFNETERLILEDSLNYYLLSYVNGSKGRMCVKAGKFELGKQYLDVGLDYARKSGNQAALAQALNVTSSFYLETGNIRKAKNLNEEIMAMTEQNGVKDNIRLGVIYTLQGRLELQMQEYERALEYLLKAKMIHDQFPKQRKNDRAYNLYYLGIAYSELGKFSEAEQILVQSVDVYNELNMGDQFMAIIWAEYGNALTQNAKYSEAKKIFDKVYQILEKDEIGVLDETTALLYRANYYQSIGNRDEARAAYEDLIQRLDVNFANINSPLSNVFYKYSHLELSLKHEQKALDLVEKALASNLNTIENHSLNVISSANHIDYLIQKSRVLKQMAERKNSTLQACLKPLDSAVHVIQSARVTRVGSEFSINALEKIKSEALDICFKLYQQTGDHQYIDKAFAYSEIAKSQLLYEWAQQASDHGVNGISDSLLNIQKKLLEQIQLYKYLVENSKRDQNENGEKFLQLTDSLSSNSKKYFDLVKNLKESNPKYYSTLYSSMFNVKPVRHISTDRNTDLIAFSQSDSSVYAFVLGANPGFFLLSNKTMFEEIIDFRQAIIEDNQIEYQKLAHRLYETFFKPLENNLTNERICILNDGSLWYLPFEILTSQNDINAEQKYLCETYQISYAYSSHFLNGIKKGDRENRTELLAMAPEFNLDISLAMNDIVRGAMIDLPGARDEIDKLGEMFQSKLMYGLNATETNFKLEAKDGAIIHLATHAIVDDLNAEFSKLVFNLVGDTLNDGYLHAYEIYNLDLNAQLVTLSACNTGFGKIKKGEGVMSLSRAFAYAGVPATVVSLWPASDKSTPELMKYFYQNLKEGQSKDVALNNAKKEYLKHATGKARHPFYWGGFVLIGDNSPIETESSKIEMLMILLLLIIAIPMAFLIKKKYLSLTEKS